MSKDRFPYGEVQGGYQLTETSVGDDFLVVLSELKVVPCPIVKDGDTNRWC